MLPRPSSGHTVSLGRRRAGGATAPQAQASGIGNDTARCVANSTDAAQERVTMAHELTHVIQDRRPVDTIREVMDRYQLTAQEEDRLRELRNQGRIHECAAQRP
ncbi:eCIS core domain-containing protein [Streptomyces netropsis]